MKTKEEILAKLANIKVCELDENDRKPFITPIIALQAMQEYLNQGMKGNELNPNIITVERRIEEIISSNPDSIHQSRLEGWQFREAIRFLAKEIDILHRLRIKK